MKTHKEYLDKQLSDKKFANGFREEMQKLVDEHGAMAYLDLWAREAVYLIKNDPYLSDEEKQAKIDDMKERAGLKEHEGHYYIPTGVLDE